MAKLAGEPKIERLQDILDLGNSSWAGAQINFHVEPDEGDAWSADYAAGCLVDGEEAVVPGAVSEMRKWDDKPDSSFYCYAPVGYIRDGARLTLQVRAKDKKGRLTGGVVWAGDFRVRLEGDDYRLVRMPSLSSGTQEELEQVPGIGPMIAQAIIAHRALNGPFNSVDELEDVPMVGADKLDSIRDLVLP